MLRSVLAKISVVLGYHERVSLTKDVREAPSQKLLKNVCYDISWQPLLPLEPNREAKIIVGTRLPFPRAKLLRNKDLISYQIQFSEVTHLKKLVDKMKSDKPKPGHC